MKRYLIAWVIFATIYVSLYQYMSTKYEEYKQIVETREVVDEETMHIELNIEPEVEEIVEETVEETIEAPIEETMVDTPPMNQLEYEELAKIIMCEAGGEDFDGKILVGNVVMNKMGFSSWNLYSTKTVIITNIYKCEACCSKEEV